MDDVFRVVVARPVRALALRWTGSNEQQLREHTGKQFVGIAGETAIIKNSHDRISQVPPGYSVLMFPEDPDRIAVASPEGMERWEDVNEKK